MTAPTDKDIEIVRDLVMAVFLESKTAGLVAKQRRACAPNTEPVRCIKCGKDLTGMAARCANASACKESELRAEAKA